MLAAAPCQKAQDWHAWATKDAEWRKKRASHPGGKALAMPPALSLPRRTGSLNAMELKKWESSQACYKVCFGARRWIKEANDGVRLVGEVGKPRLRHLNFIASNDLR